jgi:hypothetical protein
MADRKKTLPFPFSVSQLAFMMSSGQKAHHAVLSIAQLDHPHTGEMIAETLATCLTDWGIGADKVQLVVSDNGANMIKAIRLMSEMCSESDVNENEIESDIESVTEEFQTEDSDDSELTDLGLTQNMIAYRRMQCIAHTLQLTIKIAYRQFEPLLAKVRSLVGRIRKSAKMMEEIVNATGKTVITDNMTRWNSTYRMLSRLLEIKGPLNTVLNEHGVDSLMVSEWTRLDDIRRLLEPFATMTDLLQTDALSLSYAIRFLTCVDTCSSLNLTKR